MPAASSTEDAWRDHKDYALLFATDDYLSWPSLVNPVPDALAIADELKTSYGFDVNVVENPTRDQILGSLRDYGQRRYGPGDQLFIFFAGHGLYDEVFKQGYIVAQDSKMDDANRLSYESYDDLRQIINSIPAKHIILIVDACFSGTLDQKIGQASSRGAESYANFSIEELFDKKATLATRKYLTSGGKEYVPDGLPGHHSPFASQLLNVLRTYGGSQGYLTFNGILAGVENTKPQPLWGQWGDDDPGSEFLFVPKHGAKPPEPARSELREPVDESARNPSPELKRPAIAVLGFQNISNRPEDAWLSNAISEELRTNLAAGEKLRSISGENVARAKTDLSLNDASGFATDTLAKIYNVLASDYVVTGSYLPLDTSAEGKIRVELRLQNAKTGIMVAEAADSGTVPDLADLVTRLGARLRDKLGIPDPSPIQAGNARATAPSNQQAERDYTDGLAKLRAFNLLGARDSLDRAISADPKFALAHEAMASAWAELGYDQKATDEAKIAFDLDHDLSYENRLAIEGQYRQMTSEWDRAIEIYHSLWTVYPDDSEYGLELAEVQIAAGKPQDALSTVDSLRRLEGAAAAQDPRIDYQEALAAGSLADFNHEHTAAAKAAMRASQENQRLLASEAQWRDCDALFHLGDTVAADNVCQEANQGASSGAGLKFQARGLTILANIREKQGQASEAMELRQEALRLATEIGSRKDEIGALMNLAISLDYQGKSDEARADYKQAIGIANEIGDKQQLALLNFNLAANYYTQGEYASARPLYEQTLQIARQTGDKEGEANALQSLGLVDFELGNLALSRTNTEAALAEAQKTAIKSVEGVSLRQLGDIQLAGADLTGARQSYEAALKIFTASDDRSGIASIRVSLANLAIEEAHPAEAEALARQAADEFQREKDVDNEADARDMLARALMAQNKFADAQTQITTAEGNGAEDHQVILSLAVTRARAKIHEGETDQAAKELSSLLIEASSLKLVGIQLEIKLAQLESATQSAAVRANDANLLVEQARTAGFLLIASKAARFMRPIEAK